MTHAGCLHFLLLVRRQLGWRALVSLILPWDETRAEPARGVTPAGSGGRVGVPGDVCILYLVYMVLSKNKKWLDIFLHLL